MADQNSPTTEPWNVERIREAFIYDGGESEYHDPIDGAKEQRRIAGNIFDQWLAAHDAQVRGEAWDEGYGSDEECGMPRSNPYRIAGGTSNE